MRRGVVLLLVPVVVGLGACAGGDARPARGVAGLELTDVPTQLQADSRLEAAELTVEVRGDDTISWRGPVQLRVVDFLQQHFLSVGLQEVLPSGDGTAFRLAFDLMGPYRGPGEYEIPDVGGLPVGERDPAHHDLSNAFLHVARLTDPAGPVTTDNITEARVYDRLGAPCSLAVEADERAGSLSCPAVLDAGGRRVSLTWTWALSG